MIRRIFSIFFQRFDNQRRRENIVAASPDPGVKAHLQGPSILLSWKSYFRVVLVGGVLLSRIVASSATEPPTEFLTKFSACNADLFTAFKTTETTWQALGLVSREDKAWIKVPDRKDSQKSELIFPAPVEIAGLSLLSYFDEVSELLPGESYYFWGFTVSGSLGEVERKVHSLITDSSRLRRDGAVFVRTELKYGQGPWLKVNTANAAVGRTKIERVFLIEAHENRPNTVRLSCSLQGGVTPAIVKDLRPDIE